MGRRAARLAFPEIQLEFHSEHSQYKITNDTGNTVGIEVGKQAGVLSNSIVSFETQNTLGDNIGSFSVIISSQSVRWDKVLNVNDIITIRIDPNEVQATQRVYNTNIFTGLISEVSVIGQYGSNSLMYQISGQSFAKAFTQYKIGLISQVQNLISNMGWLWDINAELDPLENVGGGGSSDGKVSNITSADQKKNALAIAKYMKDHVKGSTNNAIYGLLGNWQQESSLDPSSIEKPSGAGHGLAQWTAGRWDLLQAYAKKHNKKWDNLGLQLSFALNGDGADSATLRRLLKQNGSPSEMAGRIQSQYERAGQPNTSNREAYAQSWAKYLSGKIGSGKGSGKDDTNPSSGSSSKGSTKGEVNSTQAQIDREQKNSIGVAFFGNTVATIEDNLINRFKPYMIYTYDGNKSLWDFLDYSNMQSWTDYEYLLDSSQFTNASGSLWDLQQNALRVPFNEMYFESLANGKVKLVVRRTPFNPEDWNRLTKITIDSTDIIDHEISKTDLQQYSVFVVNPATPTLLGIQDGMLLSAYPQTNQALMNIYGYAKYEVDDLYLSGRTNDNNDSGKGESDKKGKGSKKDDKKGGKKGGSKGSSKTPHSNNTPPRSNSSKPTPLLAYSLYSKAQSGKAKIDNTSGKPYTAKGVENYLNSISHNTLRLNKAKYAKYLADNANNISSAQAYDLVNSYCANGYKLSPETYNTIMQVASGGGLPNTGTQDASFKNMEACIEKSGGDLNTFMSLAKSTLKDVSDEFLRQVWQERGTDGKLTKEGYKRVYDRARNAGNATGDSVATDLKFFTRVLYNWYADNFNFYSGNIEVAGNPDIRVGCILDEVDFYTSDEYGYAGIRYYIESVSHRFSFTEGYTTTIGVTRGMRMPTGTAEDPRFSNLWGTSIDFVGGYMGEATTANLALETAAPEEDNDTSDGSAFGGAKGAEIAVKAAKFGYQFRKDSSPKINGKKMKEVYALGGHGERGSVNPLTHDINQGTIILDCSSFVYWCFKHYGASIGTITTEQANNPNMKKVNVGQSSKNMKIGDLVFMENCGHVMIYIGNGLLMGWNGGANGTASWDTTGGCQVQSLATVKSWAHGIDGYVARFK